MSISALRDLTELVADPKVLMRDLRVSLGVNARTDFAGVLDCNGVTSTFGLDCVCLGVVRIEVFVCFDPTSTGSNKASLGVRDFRVPDFGSAFVSIGVTADFERTSRVSFGVRDARVIFISICVPSRILDRDCVCLGVNVTFVFSPLVSNGMHAKDFERNCVSLCVIGRVADLVRDCISDGVRLFRVRVGVIGARELLRDSIHSEALVIVWRLFWLGRADFLVIVS